MLYENKTDILKDTKIKDNSSVPFLNKISMIRSPNKVQIHKIKTRLFEYEVKSAEADAKDDNVGNYN